MKLSSALLMAVRITGLIELILGVMFWTGNAHVLIRGHIFLGVLLTLTLFALIYLAYRSKVARWLVALSVIWAIGLPIWGLTQDRIFPETYLWLAQVLHLLCALGAMGLAELLGAQIRKKST